MISWQHLNTSSFIYYSYLADYCRWLFHEVCERLCCRTRGKLVSVPPKNLFIESDCNWLDRKSTPVSFSSFYCTLLITFSMITSLIFSSTKTSFVLFSNNKFYVYKFCTFRPFTLKLNDKCFNSFKYSSKSCEVTLPDSGFSLSMPVKK